MHDGHLDHSNNYGLVCELGHQEGWDMAEF